MSSLQSPSPPWRAWVGLEHDRVYDDSVHWSALTDGRIKYIFHAAMGREQLFDLEADPAEADDLARRPEHAATLATWRARLVAQFEAEGRGTRYVREGKLVVRGSRDTPHAAHYSAASKGARAL